jgi:hypothetical protein
VSDQVILRAPTAEEIAQAKLPAAYEAAKRAVMACVRIDECKDWADKAAALRVYAIQRHDNFLRAAATRLEARAERRIGELLKEIPDTNRGRPPEIQEGTLPNLTRAAAAEQAGLSEHQRKTAIRMANMPEEEFERAIKSASPPTVTQLAERGKVARPAVPGPPVTPADPAEVAETQSALAAFAEFCAEHDATSIASAIELRDAEALRCFVARIDAWLKQFAAKLPGRNGEAAA